MLLPSIRRIKNVAEADTYYLSYLCESTAEGSPLLDNYLFVSR